MLNTWRRMVHPSGAGDVAPRYLGFFRAIYRNFDRALRGRISPRGWHQTQAAVLNITDTQAEYARKVAESLKNKGFRVENRT